MIRASIMHAAFLGIATNLFITLFAGSAIAILDASSVVPVDVSIVDLGGGKGYGFRTTYATSFYTYDKDRPNTSNCTGKCAEIWVPVYPSQRDATDLGQTWKVITRGDGEKQWAYKGKPIYTFGSGEHEPPSAGDTAGQWHVLEP